MGMETTYKPAKWERALLRAMEDRPSIAYARRAANISHGAFWARYYNNPEFKERFEAARRAGIDRIEEIALEALYESNPDLQHSRWMLSRLRPETYGERQRIEVEEIGPVTVDICKCEGG